MKKRLIPLLLILTLALPTVAYSKVDPSMTNMYNTVFSHLTTLEEQNISPENTNSKLNTIERAIFLNKYIALRTLLAATLKDDQYILEEHDSIVKDIMGLDTIPPNTVKIGAYDYISETTKSITALTSPEEQAEKAKESSSSINHVTSLLNAYLSDLKKYEAISNEHMQTPINYATTISDIEDERDKLKDLLDPLQTLFPTLNTLDTTMTITGSTLSENIGDGYFTALYASIIGATSTLNPMQSSIKDLATLPNISEAEQTILTEYGDYRKPLYITTGYNSIKSYLAGGSVNCTGARLKDVFDNKDKEFFLVTILGETEKLEDVNTVTGENRGTVVKGGTNLTDTTDFSPPIYMQREERNRLFTPDRNVTDIATSTKTRAVEVGTTVDPTNCNTNFSMLNNMFDNISPTDSELNTLLYLDAFGNIVLENNLVLIPAMANATLYEGNTVYPMATKYAYNTYPSNNDEKKRWFLKGDIGFLNKATMAKKSWFGKDTSLFGEFQCMLPEIEVYLEENSIGGETYQLFVNVDDSATDSKFYIKNGSSNVTTTLDGKVRTIGLSYFEDYPDINLLLKRSNSLAFLGGVLYPNTTLYKLIADEVCKGSKDYKEYALLMTESTLTPTSMLSEMLSSILNPLMNITNKATGFTYLKDSSTSPILNTFFKYLRIYQAAGVILAVYLFLRLHNRKEHILTQIISVGAFLLIMVFGIRYTIDFAMIVFNRAVTADVSIISDRNTMYRSLIIAEERRIRNIDDIENIPITSSLSTSLYKYDYDEAPSHLTLNPKEGSVYIEGRYVKILTSDLFSSLSIVNNPSSEDNETERDISMTYNRDVSEIKQYTIFYDIAEHLTQRLSTFAELSKPSVEYIRYTDSVSKASYLWKELASSVLVLDYKELKNLPSVEADPKLLTETLSTFGEYDLFDLRNINIALPNTDNVDAGISSKLVRLDSMSSIIPTGEYTYLLSKNFTEYTPEYKEAYDRFITGANYRIKKFLIENYDVVAMASDETITKVITLMLIEEFSVTMSSPINGRNYLPDCIDSSNMSLEDILIASNKSLSWEDFHYSGLMDIITSSYGNFGYLVGLFTLPIIALNLWAIYAFPYFLLVVLFVVIYLRVMRTDGILTALKGFGKCSLVYFLIFFVQSRFIMSGVSFGYKYAGLFVLALLNLNFLIALARIIRSNPYDMGDTLFGLGMQHTVGAKVVNGSLNKSLIKLQERKYMARQYAAEADTRMRNNNGFYNATRNYMPHISSQLNNVSDRLRDTYRNTRL